MIRWIWCLLTGHGKRRRRETDMATLKECSRCGAVLDREYTYEHRAKKALEKRGFRHQYVYEPVDRAERGGSILEPGDRLCYTRDSAFPGIVGHRQGVVEYLYETPDVGEETIFAAVVDREQTPIHERRWVGIRDGDDGPAPTPGLRTR